MGFRFRRRIRLGRGIWLNVSKSGTSLSAGGHGATVNFGKKGTTATVGLHGTGLSYRNTPRRQMPQEGAAQPQSPIPWWLRPLLLLVLIAVVALVGQSHIFK